MAIACDIRIAVHDAVFAIPAARLGLVSRVSAVDQLPALLAEYTGSIGDNSPLTIAAAKAISHEILKPAPEFDAQGCQRLILACFDSEDHAEGRRAFMEKRKPRFLGR